MQKLKTEFKLETVSRVFRGQNKTESTGLGVMYKKLMKPHILKRIPWVASFVWEETSMQHFIVDVPVFHFALHSSHIHCKKRLTIFPVPSRNATNQTLPGREYYNYNRPGRVW